jgi:hypothetical protein
MRPLIDTRGRVYASIDDVPYGVEATEFDCPDCGGTGEKQFCDGWGPCDICCPHNTLGVENKQ